MRAQNAKHRNSDIFIGLYRQHSGMSFAQGRLSGTGETPVYDVPTFGASYILIINHPPGKIKEI